MATKTYKLGPGTLKLGETGSSLDITAQITSAQVEWEVDAEDAVPVLDGTEEAGDVTYTATLSGNLFQDLGEAEGIVERSWSQKGAVVACEFIPNTVIGKRVIGNVELRPITIGGDVKTKQRSDFEFPFIGEPELDDVAP